jgi:hypothetical protein
VDIGRRVQGAICFSMGYRLAVLCVLDCLLGAGRFRLCPALEGDSRVDAVIRTGRYPFQRISGFVARQRETHSRSSCRYTSKFSRLSQFSLHVRHLRFGFSSRQGAKALSLPRDQISEYFSQRLKGRKVRRLQVRSFVSVFVAALG